MKGRVFGPVDMRVAYFERVEGFEALRLWLLVSAVIDSVTRPSIIRLVSSFTNADSPINELSTVPSVRQKKFSCCIDRVSDKISNSPQDSLVRKCGRHQNSLGSFLPRVPTIRAWCVLALLRFAACALALCLAGCALALFCLLALASGRSKSDSTAFSPPPFPSTHPRLSIPMNSNPEGPLMQENHEPMSM